MNSETQFNKCPVCGRLVINNSCNHPTIETDKENK